MILLAEIAFPVDDPPARRLLAALGCLAEFLARPHDPAEVFADFLLRCLDASDLPAALVYLAAGEGRYRLQGQAGIPAASRTDAEACFGHPEIVDRIVEAGQPVALTRHATDPGGDAATLDFLARFDHAAVLVAPLAVLGQGLGALLLGADGENLASETWIGFGRILAVQLGHTAALAQSRNRLAAAEERYLLDAAERRRAEAALREAQQRLEHVVSSNPAVLYSLMVEGGHRIPRWVSDNIHRLTGDSVEEALTPGWWFSHVHPDDLAAARTTLSALLAEGSLVREYRLRDKHGRNLWIRDEQIVIRDAAGNPVEVLGSWSEVTARKQVELRLAESEMQYRLLFDDSPQPMWVFDDETLALLAVNDAAARHYGYARDEMLALTLRDLHATAELEVAGGRQRWHRREGAHAAFASPRAGKHRKKGGGLIDVEIALSPIEFHGRQAWLALTHDVTEKKRLEAQVLQAQKMESVGRLAGGVAHDFNNLLTAILGYSQLLAGELGARSDLRAHVDEIRNAGERAAALTRQLLAFSRSQILQPQVIEVNEVVLGVERLLRRLIGENIELVTILGSRAGHSLVDLGQLEQVIVNLAVNARDAMPHGGKLILETADIELAELAGEEPAETPPGDYVMVAVADNGLGMDAAILSHLFEPFFTTKERGKGTGLGLSTVYGIVRQSGGRIEVHSEAGLGSRFRVFLPRVAAPAAGAAGLAGAVPVRRPSAETVLLIEDEGALRALVRTLLERDGHTVLEAKTSETALCLARDHSGPIHLVLSDVVMPGMSGPAVAARIALLRPETRFLFMSGYPGSALGQRDLLPRGAPFLEKPFTAEILRQKIREQLDRPAPRRPA
jgi:two-component system cell cycle sensor histidine kinase/response regulator CckA